MATSIAAVKINEIVVCHIEFPTDSVGLEFTLQVGNQVRKGVFTQGFVSTTPAKLEAQGIARIASAADAELQHKRGQTQAQVTVALGSSFAIGPGNTYQQAWAAALAGHQIQLPIWSPDFSWVFERNHQELLSVYGNTHESWKRSGTVVCPTGAHQLRTDWIVLPIIDAEPPTV